MKQIEEWRNIPNYCGRYQVSLGGRVRAYYRYKGHLLFPHYKELKYDGRSVRLYNGGVSSKHCVDYLLELCYGVFHIKSLDGEVWKSVNGYEGYYKISNKGRLMAERRILTRKNGVMQFFKEQIVSAKSIINSGYYVVNLLKEKALKHVLVHRLVAEHFVENPNGFDFVNHKDENKLNNDCENLEWCTRTYNQTYGTCQERRIATRLKNNNGRYGYKRKDNR